VGYASTQSSGLAIAALILSSARCVLPDDPRPSSRSALAHAAGTRSTASGGRISGQGLVRAAQIIAWVHIILVTLIRSASRSPSVAADSSITELVRRRRLLGLTPGLRESARRSERPQPMRRENVDGRPRLDESAATRAIATPIVINVTRMMCTQAMICAARTRALTGDPPAGRVDLVARRVRERERDDGRDHRQNTNEQMERISAAIASPSSGVLR